MEARTPIYGADGVADEDDTFKLQIADDLHKVFGIAGKIPVFDRGVGGEIGAAGAYIVEEDGGVVDLEAGGHKPPHVLIAAKAMREHHRATTDALHTHVISLKRRHGPSPAGVRFGQGQPRPRRPSKTTIRLAAAPVRVPNSGGR